MTVQDLIDVLGRHRPDGVVATLDADGDPTEVYDVRDFGPDDYVVIINHTDDQRPGGLS